MRPETKTVAIETIYLLYRLPRRQAKKPNQLAPNYYRNRFANQFLFPINLNVLPKLDPSSSSRSHL